MLGTQNQNDLLRLAAQTNMPLAQLQQQAAVQGAMQQQSGVIEVPQVTKTNKKTSLISAKMVVWW